jgi:HEAT repeat protein/lysophospholipase L1-like esterase
VTSSVRSLAQNLLLSAASSIAFLLLIEVVARLVEQPRAEAHGLPGVADWAEWDGEFYTIAGGPRPGDQNRDGIRDRPHAIAKPAGVRRVFCLGDSTTYGQHLLPEQAWPQRLQELLDARSWGVEVFNVALPGWSARQERIAYRHICRKYGPDQVLLAICLNDIPDMQNNLARPPPLLAWAFSHSALVRRVVDPEARHIQGVRELFGNEETPRVREGYRRLYEEIRALRDDAQADGASLALIVLPFRLQLAPDAPPPRPQAALAAFCAAEGIPLLDLLPAFRRAGAGAFVDDDHPTASGAEIVATEVLGNGLVAVESEDDALEASASLPELIRTLTRPEPRAKLRALHALALRGPSAADAVPALRALLEEPGPQFRAAAARALGQIGPPPATAAAAALARRLDDPDADVRHRAEEALHAIHPAPDHCLGELTRILETPAASGREEAARIVGAMGPEARGAVEALVVTLRDERVAVREEAVSALGQIGPDAAAAAPALLARIHDPDLRWRVVDALGALGPGASAAVPALAAALEDESGDVRRLAARALGRIGPAARSAAPRLVNALGDRRDDVRLAAARALPRVDADPKLARPALEKLLHGPNDAVRKAAAAALRRLSPRSTVASDD